MKPMVENARDTARLKSLMEMSAHDLRAEYLAACESFADIDDRAALAHAERYAEMVAAIFKHRFPELDIVADASGRIMTREEIEAELSTLTERADALARTLSESPLVMVEDRAAADDIACRLRRILRNL